MSKIKKLFDELFAEVIGISSNDETEMAIPLDRLYLVAKKYGVFPKSENNVTEKKDGK